MEYIQPGGNAGLCHPLLLLQPRCARNCGYHRREEPDREVPAILIIIGPAVPGEADRRPKLFHEPDVFINGPFGDIQFTGQVCRAAGAFVQDEVIHPDQPVDEGLHDGIF